MKTIGLDISVLNDQQRTGIGVYTYGLIRALLSENKEDKFILFGFATFSTYNFLKNIEFKKYPNVELKIYRMPARLFRTAFFSWQKINWPLIERLVGKVDIFHSFNWYLPPQKFGKVVATVFDMTPLLYPNFHQQKTIQLDRLRLNRIRRKADLVITISENSKKDFLKFAPGKRVEVIYPGVGDNFLNKHVSKSVQVLTKYHLKPGFILSVGTIEPRKNIEKVILAFAKLASQGLALSAYKLVIAGAKGWMSDEIYKLPKRLGIENRVTFLGRVEEEDLPYLYKNAFCLVYPSLYEGFGIPVLEAQASGCPVITSATSSLPEAAGKGAILVDPYDVDEIANTMIRVMPPKASLAKGGGKAKKVKLIKAGRENTKRFSWQKSAKKLNLLYQQL